MRRGNGVSERPLNRHLDPVLLRHGCHWPELERPYVPPLEAGDQLCLGMASEQLVVKGDESFCSPLQDSIEPIEPREEIVSTGSSLGLQVMASHLEPRQLHDPKAAKRVIKALYQSR